MIKSDEYACLKIALWHPLQTSLAHSLWHSLEDPSGYLLWNPLDELSRSLSLSCNSLRDTIWGGIYDQTK